MRRFFFCTLLLGFALEVFAQSSANNSRIARAAESQIGVTLYYDPAYRVLAYPHGDVPLERGVCSDVVIRAFRAVGVDLQKLVHEDMRRAFGAYPKLWGLHRPDRNIDHRRVANLEVFLARRGRRLALSQRGLDYRAGDIVTWTLPSGRLHIGVVTNKLEPSGQRPLVVHNIGAGAQLEDILFAYKMRMRFRYF
ncbi:MAG: DUF1287 domain-containing protein [Deinococcales bacterium]